MTPHTHRIRLRAPARNFLWQGHHFKAPFRRDSDGKIVEWKSMPLTAAQADELRALRHADGRAVFDVEDLPR